MSRGRPSGPTTPATIDVEKVRRDFPYLELRTDDRPVAYLDNAATAQKPRAVIDAVGHFYAAQCANVHRGLYRLSVEATAAYEDARIKLQRFIGAADCREIVFTSGTTAAINLVAHSFGSRIGVGDEVLVTQMEHHSNIVPWQLLCERTGATLRVVPFDDDGELILPEYERLLGPRTKLLALAHTSNALGSRNPVETMIEQARSIGVPVLLDAAQALPHESVDVQALGCDFLAFSGHKMFGPTGIGVLYGRAEMLEAMPPFLGGGEMIHSVSFDGTSFKEPPHRFEAGTPDIAGAIGLGAAVDYLSGLGMDRVAAYEQELLDYAGERLRAIPRLRVVGTARRKCAILSFVVDGVHAHDLGTVLDTEGIAVRAGHHCAQPAMERLGLAATARASLAFYNNREEIDRLVEAIPLAIRMLG